MENHVVSIADIVSRLSSRTELLSRRGVRRGSALWEFWQSFNDPKNPLRRIDLTPSRAAPVLNLLADTVCNETILVIVRAFEPPGRSGHMASERATYPMLAALARQPGVRDAIADGGLGDPTPARAHERIEAIDEMDRILIRLRREDPNRLERLRDYRDEFLAHILVRREPKAEPLFGDITTMLEEMEALSEATERAFKPFDTFWPRAWPDIGNRSDDLWGLILKGAQASAATS